jgi:hypothetical protein
MRGFCCIIAICELINIYVVTVDVISHGMCLEDWYEEIVCRVKQAVNFEGGKNISSLRTKLYDEVC